MRNGGIWGGDAVGMSTACEAMAARHMGIEVCGISCITNMAAGISKQELNHKEVQETADRVAKSFKKLVDGNHSRYVAVRKCGFHKRQRKPKEYKRNKGEKL